MNVSLRVRVGLKSVTKAENMAVRRNRSLLIGLAIALALALVPHPRSPNPAVHEHYVAVAQEVHGQSAESIVEAEDACISLTLLGCMGFIMAIFYLVNWPDKDIQRISLEVVSTTISIFGALLLFHSCEEILEHYLFHHLSLWQEVALGMFQMIFWFVLLQVVLAYYSGALGAHHTVLKRTHSRSLAESADSPTRRATLQKSSDEHLKAIELNTHAWSILLGHATGFAAKNACSALQQAVPRNFLCCAMIPVFAFLVISLIYSATNLLRHHKAMADGEEDEFEALWAEYAAETEDEVISLAVSFLVVQMLRFGISGYLPDASGEDPAGHALHSNWSCALLLLVGLVPGVADVVRLLGRRSVKRIYKLVSGVSPALRPGEERMHTWFEGISTMSFAWCIHFAVDWWVASNFELDGSIKAVVSALLVTLLAFVLIFVLDKVADMHFKDIEVDKALRGMIAGLGMLVGFSWERCFHASVGGLANHHSFTVSAPLGRFLVASFLAIMVLPAWKWYILPMLHAHNEHHDEFHEVHDLDHYKGHLGDETRLFGRLDNQECCPRHAKTELSQ